LTFAERIKALLQWYGHSLCSGGVRNYTKWVWYSWM